MHSAYIVEALRTPVCKRGGELSEVHPVDLAATPISAVVEKTGIDPRCIDDVIMGCIDQIGPQSADIARTAWLAAGYPEHVPGVTIDRRCGSSQQAVHFAAATIMAGVNDLVLAGGTQHMSSLPLGSSYSAGRTYGFDDPLEGSEGWYSRYQTKMFSQLEAADLIAQKWALTRGQLEEYAVTSHERALTAQAASKFADEIVPIAGIRSDSGPRVPDRAQISQLSPLYEGGTNTPATSSQISDGAAVLLVASEQAVDKYQLVPRARVKYMSAVGDDPRLMLTAPIRGTQECLAELDLRIDDFDAIEINEAFSAVPLIWLNEIGADANIVNPNGGAIALGHPIGATGARLMTTLLHELERIDGSLGLQTMCEGGGQANVTVLERL
jgi:acetyl-CoA C-acetyltransferase